MDDFATVVSPAGEERETLRLLLRLADKPRHVRLDHDEPGTHLVPEYLAQRYQDTLGGSPEPVEEQEQEPVEEPTSTPKRRGRPPGSRNKTPQAADDKDGED